MVLNKLHTFLVRRKLSKSIKSGRLLYHRIIDTIFNTLDSNQEELAKAFKTNPDLVKQLEEVRNSLLAIDLKPFKEVVVSMLSQYEESIGKLNIEKVINKVAKDIKKDWKNT